MKPIAPRFAACVLAAVLGLAATAFAQKPAKAPPASKGAQTPGPLENLYRQAEQALEKQDFTAAAQALEKYLADRPQDPYAHFQLGYAYTGLNRTADAQKEYAKAAELDPQLAAAHLNLGLILLDSNPAAAVPPLEQAAALQPGEARPRYLLGLACERSGNAARAVEHFRAAAQLDAKSFDIQFALGRVLLALNRAEQAEQYFRAALELRSNATPAHLGLAESLVAQRKLEAAAGEYITYLEARPEDRETRFQLAALYADLGKDAEALAELERAATAGLRTLAADRLRIDLLLRLKQFDAAGKALEEALATRAEDAELHARLGRVRLEQRDFPAAERALLTALRLKPELTEALRDLVAVYYLGEKWAATLAVLDKLGQRESLATGSWFVRATCYDKLQMKAEALTAYKTFVGLDQGRSERQDFQARQRIRILTRELERKR